MNERPKEDLSFSRGPILKFRIAEIILFFFLIIFVALCIVLLKKESEIKKLKETVSPVSKNHLIRNKIPSINETADSVSSGQNVSDDMLNEINALHEENRRLQHLAEALKKNLAEVDQILKDSNLKSGNKRVESIREALKIRETHDKPSDRDRIDSLVLSIKLKDLEIAKLKDEVRYLRNQLDNCRALGKGSSYSGEHREDPYHIFFEKP